MITCRFTFSLKRLVSHKINQFVTDALLKSHYSEIFLAFSLRSFKAAGFVLFQNSLFKSSSLSAVFIVLKILYDLNLNIIGLYAGSLKIVSENHCNQPTKIQLGRWCASFCCDLGINSGDFHIYFLVALMPSVMPPK